MFSHTLCLLVTDGLAAAAEHAVPFPPAQRENFGGRVLIILNMLRRGLRPFARGFNSRAEHASWVRRVVHARMAKPLGWMQATKESAPFIASTDHMVDHLVLQCMPRSELEGGALTPSASALQATWPVSTDELLATSVVDRNGYSPFRLGKFYEAVDALTADVAYRHTDGHARGLALVTASHYHAIKLGRTVAGRDVTIRCYVTSTGSSSLEVRTDALQVDESGQERLINVCHTAMVALDKSTMRPVKGAVPPLELPAKQEAAGLDARDDPNPNQIERLELAKLHKVMMARRRANEMLLRSPVSQPPTSEEMAAVHELHRGAVASFEAPAPRVDRPDEISYHTHTSSTVVFAESKNVHGKAFGGFVAGGAYDLAYYAARYFTRGAPFVPVGLDDAVFLQSVSIGDMVRWEARVVHSGEDGIFRVHVSMDVIDPFDPGRLPERTNRLMFVFATSPSHRRPLLPTSYKEVLMHVSAARRHATEGLGPKARVELEAFFREATA